MVPSDILRINIAVPYKGPERDFTLYGSIGKRGIFGFVEIISARASLPCPDSPEKFVTVTGDLDIDIVGSNWFGIGGISAGNDYDLYVKIEERPDVMVEIDDVIDIAGSTGSDMTSMMGMMMPLMMLGMVMPILGEGMEG